MDILSKAHIHTTAKAGIGSDQLIDALMVGNGEASPELLALLKQLESGPDSKEQSFETLLQESEISPELEAELKQKLEIAGALEKNNIPKEGQKENKLLVVTQENTQQIQKENLKPDTRPEVAQIISSKKEGSQQSEKAMPKELKALLSKKEIKNVESQEVKPQVVVEKKPEATKQLKDNNVLLFQNKLAAKNTNLKAHTNISKAHTNISKAHTNISKAYQNQNQSIFANTQTQTDVAPKVQQQSAPTQSLKDILFNTKTGEQTATNNDSMSGGDSGLQSQLASTEFSDTLSKTDTDSAKVKSSFNLNSLSDAKTTTEVINKIQDYLVQSKVDGNKQVEMSFNHKELGTVDLKVEKLDNNELSIKIATHTTEGGKFFQAKQTQLIQTLNQSGLQISEFKLDTNSASNNLSNSSNNNSSGEQKFAGQKQEHQSQSGQQQEESRKRNELWSLFQDKEAA